MKRVVLTVTNDLTYDQRMQKICGSLASAGYAATLTGRKMRNSAPLASYTFAQKRLKCFFDKGKAFYLEYNLRLFFYLLFTPCDIICAIDLDTILPCWAAARIRGKKVVYDAHEYFTEVPEVVGRPAVQRVWQWVEAFAVPRMDACITVGERLGQLFSEAYGRQFVIIRNVPVLNREQPLADHDAIAPYILYQGALNKGRGLEQLIESAARLPVQVMIAGEGDLSDELRSMVARMGLQDKVKFLGWVSPEKLKEMTPGAFLGYNLLENLGKSYYYSLSNKFFDYMHAGVPGLFNDFPEYKKINEACEVGILTNLSVEDIVLKVDKALKEREYYNYLVKNCLLAREEYNWQAEEKKLLQLYGDL